VNGHTGTSAELCHAQKKERQVALFINEKEEHSTDSATHIRECAAQKLLCIVGHFFPSQGLCLISRKYANRGHY
jgi:hypothetical protein